MAASDLARSISHRWDLSPADAVLLQKTLTKKLAVHPLPDNMIRLVAGADVSSDIHGELLHAAVCVCDYRTFQTVERATVSLRPPFPYIPGLLSFREGPALMECFRHLKNRPDVTIFDGQGIAHPRRFGIAAHIGLLLGIPSIGCAKSRLYGLHREPGQARGSKTELTDPETGKVIGSVLRTRAGVKPVFVSTGHGIDLESAERVVLNCARKYRLPEPVRCAHTLAGETRIAAKSAVTRTVNT